MTKATTKQAMQKVHDWTNGKIVYDISVAHPDGQGNPTPYADLTAALGNGGANIPEPLRKGGMSVKFIKGSTQSSDNNYTQYRLKAQTFSTVVADWEIVNKVSDAVNAHFKPINLGEKHQGMINNNKKWDYVTGTSARYHCLVSVNPDDAIYVIGGGGVAYWLSSYTTPVNGESAAVIGNKIGLTDNVAQVLTAPANAMYLYLHVRSGYNSYYPKYITFYDDDDILKIQEQILLSESKIRTTAIGGYVGDITDKLNFRNGSVATNACNPDYTDNTCLISNLIDIDPSAILNIKNDSNESLIVKVALLQPNGKYIVGSASHPESFNCTLNIANEQGIVLMVTKSDSSSITVEDIGSITIIKEDTKDSDIAKIQEDLYGNIDLSKLEIHKGYIAKEDGQWVWNNVTATSRQHVVIPCVAGDIFEITSNDVHTTSIIFISAYNVVEDGLCGYVSNPTAPAVGETESYEVPSGATYMYLQYNSSYIVYLPKVVRKIDDSISFDDLRNGKRNDSILSFNNEQEILQRLVNAKLTWSNRTPSFTMIHFSDMHNNQENFDRIEEFANHYNAYLDLILHTGDSVGGSYTQTAPIPWNDNAKFLNVLGNHDCERANDGNPREGETELNGKYLAPRSAPYNKNFAPYIDNWGVIRPSGATTEMYYYKDYATYGIRLICIDRYYWDNTQKQWLIDTLADAKTNSLEVIMASHEGAFKLLTAKDASNPFDSLDYDLTGTMVMPEAVAAVKSFVDGGGTLICWLTGHMHADAFGMSTDSRYSGMLDICVSAAGKHLANQEYSRPDGTKAMDLFNIYSIDVVKKRLSIVRIGADYDMYMRHKNSLVWDYANKQILYKD